MRILPRNRRLEELFKPVADWLRDAAHERPVIFVRRTVIVMPGQGADPATDRPFLPFSRRSASFPC